MKNWEYKELVFRSLYQKQMEAKVEEMLQHGWEISSLYKSEDKVGLIFRRPQVG